MPAGRSADGAGHADDPLAAQVLRDSVRLGGLLRVEDDLHDALAIAQVDERDAAVVARCATHPHSVDLAAGVARREARRTRACASRSRSRHRSVHPSSLGQRAATSASGTASASPSSSRRSVTAPSASSCSPMIAANCGVGAVGHLQLRLQRTLLVRSRPPSPAARSSATSARAAARAALADRDHVASSGGSLGGGDPFVGHASSTRSRPIAEPDARHARTAERFGEPVVPAARRTGWPAARCRPLHRVADELERGSRVVVEAPHERGVMTGASPAARTPATTAVEMRVARVAEVLEHDGRARRDDPHASSLQSSTRSGLSSKPVLVLLTELLRVRAQVRDRAARGRRAGTPRRRSSSAPAVASAARATAGTRRRARSPRRRRPGASVPNTSTPNCRCSR